MTLLTYPEALDIILKTTVPLPSVRCPVGSAVGYYLASDVSAAIDLPRFDNSQMDGYALRFQDTRSSSLFNVIGIAPAGGSQSIVIGPNEATKIFTGAPIPRGADTIVPIEDVTSSDDGLSIELNERLEESQFIRNKGEDVSAGQRVSRRGDIIASGRAALLISSGCGEVDVYRKAKVVVLTNGDELVDNSITSDTLLQGQIYDSNAAMLAALVREADAELVKVVRTQDSHNDLLQLIENIVAEEKPDLIISSGGVSVGDRDFVRSVVTQLGNVLFWRAAIRPGKPILYGRIGSTHFLGLPGNPASTLVTFEIFARPLIRKLQGSNAPITFVPTKLAARIGHQAGRRSFVRAITRVTSTGLVSLSAGAQGSHYISSLAEANSLVVVPEDCDGLESGAPAGCLLTGPLLSD
jgi:molybdopterin molybdotransferase